jgi:rRNA maturation endonuclease Nob1
MNVILGILMVAVAALYVAAPFFRRDADEDAPLSEPIAPTEILERQKREAYAAIKEAEFDHEMAKLTDADFAALTEKYRLQALAAIAGLERRGEHGEGGDARAPKRVAFCATCGHKLPARANFCPACGRAIKADRESLRAQASETLSSAVAQTG